MRIIIPGGSGLIGKALSKALVADGHETIVLSRNPEKIKAAPAGVRLHQWDGESAAGWRDLAQGDYALVNLAGETIAQRWSKENRQAIRHSRVAAGKAILDVINQAETKPRVLIQSSAVGYYGTSTGDAPVTESFSPGDDLLRLGDFHGTCQQAWHSTPHHSHWHCLEHRGWRAATTAAAFQILCRRPSGQREPMVSVDPYR